MYADVLRMGALISLTGPAIYAGVTHSAPLDRANAATCSTRRRGIMPPVPLRSSGNSHRATVDRWIPNRRANAPGPPKASMTRQAGASRVIVVGMSSRIALCRAFAKKMQRPAGHTAIATSLLKTQLVWMFVCRAALPAVTYLRHLWCTRCKLLDEARQPSGQPGHVNRSFYHVRISSRNRRRQN